MNDEIRKKIESMKNLEEGWDSYGAPPISSFAIESVEDLMEKTHVFPRSCGGINIVIPGKDFEIEIDLDSDGLFDTFFIEKRPVK